MHFRRNLAGFLLLLLTIAGGVPTAPTRLHATQQAYVHILEARERQQQHELLTNAPEPAKPSEPGHRRSEPNASPTACCNPRSPPELLS